MIGWLLIAVSFLVLTVGSYLYPDLFLVKVFGWAFFVIGIVIAGKRLTRLVATRRKQADEYREKHPANEDNRK